jgi:hypothetical protein
MRWSARGLFATSARPRYGGRGIAALWRLAESDGDQDDDPEDWHMRRSISCMLAGLLTVVPVWVLFAADNEWAGPMKGRLIASLIFIFAVGVMWLYDETVDGSNPCPLLRPPPQL